MKRRVGLVGLFTVLVPLGCAPAGASPDGGADLAETTPPPSTSDAGEPPPAPTSDAGGESAKPPTFPRGVYVPTFNRPIVGTGGSATLQQLLKNEDVDGFFVSRLWKDVEPTKGAYDFDSLLNDVKAVAAAGKKATIGIGAGINAPSYLCQSAKCLSLVIHPPQAVGQCISETLPLPWDATLQERFGAMVGALAHAIDADAGVAAAVVDVKITGFNDRNEETILPSSTGATVPCTAGDACVGGECAQSDAMATLKAAGYSDATATSAILAYAKMFHDAFPRIAAGAQVSPGLPSPDSDNVHVVMDNALLADSSLRPLTAQNQGLSGKEQVDQGLVAAQAAGVPIGFQMLAYVAGNPTCLMGHGLGADGGDAPCDQSVLQAAVDHGIKMGASWIEIYAQDVVAYPAVIGDAHAQLAR